MSKIRFEWDDDKNQLNQKKHGVSFYEAQKAFLDHKRVIAEDFRTQQRRKKILLLRQDRW